MIPKTCISLGLRVIPPGSGLARSRRPIVKTDSIGHHWPDQTRMRNDEGYMMSKLLEYTLGKYQERLNKLKQIKPNTVGYECLMKEIDRLWEKLDQIRRQIVERKR